MARTLVPLLGAFLAGALVSWLIFGVARTPTASQSVREESASYSFINPLLFVKDQKVLPFLAIHH